MLRFVLLFGFVCFLSRSAPAQSLIKQADRELDQRSFAKAVRLYEEVLADQTSLSASDQRAIQAKLGYSYQQLRDAPNAERVFRKLIGSEELPADYTPYYLNFAQVLASNGKYGEAQRAYERYSALKRDDKRPAAPVSKLSRDVSALTSNTGRYRLEFLNINTRRAEFSPVRYKDGLVFVTAGEGTGIRRVFTGKNSPFLDLYYLPDLGAVRGIPADGSASARRPEREPVVRSLGRDDYTARTANDSRTVGTFRTDAGALDYRDQPTTESGQFSRTLNTRYHEGPATFTRDGSRVIFTRNNYTDGHYEQSKDGINKLKLYTATQTAGSWSEPEELPFNSDEYSTGHPALAKGSNGEPDQLLYFSSNRPGGFGGTDLYVAKWTKGGWGEPVNLGKEINSKGNELFPFVDERGNLYFSSEGHAGLGGLDLFYAPLSPDGQRGRRPHHLGEPFNSPKDDFGIVTDGGRTAGYFSSNRKNGGADDDIYRFTRDGSAYPCRQLTVSVFDAVSDEPLPNALVAFDGPAGNRPKPLKTDAEGLVRICLDGSSEFQFAVSRDGYVDNRVGFSARDLSDDEPSRLEIPLSKPAEAPKPTRMTLRGRVLAQSDRSPIAGARVMAVNECDGTVQQTTSGSDGTYQFTIPVGCAHLLEATKKNMGNAGSRVDEAGVGITDLYLFKKGDVITIDNIYYDLNRATIRPDAAVELDKLADLMMKYPAMTIELRSHTDSRATTQYNKTLSGNRAKSVVSYLKGRGIAAKRMTAKGYGESQLLNDCRDGVDCPEEEHQRNRRTEIKVLKLQ